MLASNIIQKQGHSLAILLLLSFFCRTLLSEKMLLRGYQTAISDTDNIVETNIEGARNFGYRALQISPNITSVDDDGDDAVPSGSPTQIPSELDVEDKDRDGDGDGGANDQNESSSVVPTTVPTKSASQIDAETPSPTPLPSIASVLFPVSNSSILNPIIDSNSTDITFSSSSPSAAPSLDTSGGPSTLIPTLKPTLNPTLKDTLAPTTHVPTPTPRCLNCWESFYPTPSRSPSSFYDSIIYQKASDEASSGYEHVEAMRIVSICILLFSVAAGMTYWGWLRSQRLMSPKKVQLDEEEFQSDHSEIALNVMNDYSSDPKPNYDIAPRLV